MRQYRGMTKDGKWVYGWYCEVDGKHYIIPNTAEMLGAGWENPDGVPSSDEVIYGYVEVIPETVGQSTGLKDKNDKDLDWWEGDIFARSSDRQIEGIVIYDLGCFWLDRKRGGRTPLYECVDWSMCKVGDIHTKPELMEQENGQ